MLARHLALLQVGTCTAASNTSLFFNESMASVRFCVLDCATRYPMARDLACCCLGQVARDYSLPIRQRANLWLEIFGNTLVQVLSLTSIHMVEEELIMGTPEVVNHPPLPCAKDPWWTTE